MTLSSYHLDLFNSYIAVINDLWEGKSTLCLHPDDTSLLGSHVCVKLMWLVVLQNPRNMLDLVCSSRTLSKTVRNGMFSESTSMPSFTVLAAESWLSSDDTLFLTPRLRPWDDQCKPCLCWYFVLEQILLSHVDLCCADYSLCRFICHFILPWIPLHWPCCPQRPCKARQSNPAQETSQPVIAGSQWSGHVLIFILQTPRTT